MLIDEQGFRYRAETHTAAARARVERVAAEVAERSRAAAARADGLFEGYRVAVEDRVQHAVRERLAQHSRVDGGAASGERQLFDSSWEPEPAPRRPVRQPRRPTRDEADDEMPESWLRRS